VRSRHANYICFDRIPHTTKAPELPMQSKNPARFKYPSL
jgi:hypothetical protein